MKIAFVSPYFLPETHPAAVMMGQLVRHFSDKGWDVGVCTSFPSHPQGVTFPGYKRRLWAYSEDGGIPVIRCFSFNMGTKRRPLGRMLCWLSFGVTAGLRVLVQKRSDVLVVESYPLVGTLPILIAALIRRVPVINCIQDIYPESAQAAGIIPRNSAISNFAQKLDAAICRLVEINLVISEGFERVLLESRGIPRQQIEVIFNWIDGSHIVPLPRINSWREEKRIPSDKFVAMFAGTIGLVSGADLLIDVAEKLRDRRMNDILILVIGEGVLKEQMIEQARKHNLENLVFFPFQPAERLSEMQSSADVMLLPMKESHAFSSVPSKLITYMAVGRPVLCSANEASPVSQMILRADCGRVVSAGDAEAIAEELVQMFFNRPGCEKKGRNGRAFFEKYLNMPMAMKKFECLLSRFQKVPATDQGPK
ncbi:MAG: glycosyltransferase family 4 protein [Desulfomonilaceae bacterium]